MQPSMAPRTESARSKRRSIVAAAIDRFGSDGYEHTKWSTVADDVGIGQTALYHYFESKAHCLMTIMRIELTQSLERFQRVTSAEGDPVEALRLAVHSAYEGSPRDALQRRILQNHVDLLSTPRPWQKEEQERQRSRALVGEIEDAWTDLIRRGVRSGALTDRDPEVSARMVLALVVGVWRWYRPGGTYDLDEIGVLTSEAALRIVA
jgi:TetR/AcrR family transcriptional regulator, cholesterol catabolism regulator